MDGRAAEPAMAVGESVELIGERCERRRKAEVAVAGGGGEAPAVDLSNVSARTNLNETAFFFPHLNVRRTGPSDAEVHDARGTDRVEIPGVRT